MPTRRRGLRISVFTALLAAIALAVALATLPKGGSRSSGTTPVVRLTSSASANSSAADVYRRTHRGVVKITTDGGLGTGVVLDARGDILTNDHVVAGASRLSVSFDSGTRRAGRVLGTDPSDDLALIRIDASGLKLHPLTLGGSNGTRVGDTVYAIGNPFGYTNSFSEGIVSGIGRTIKAPNGFTISHAIQTDASINPGNSGGPLLDASGRVIGINAQIAVGDSAASGTGQSDGVGFAIPIDTAKSVIGQLETSGHVSHGYLGVATSDAPQAGAVVENVQPGSPADAAGVAAGDVIRSLDGKPVTGSDALVSAVSARRAGDRVDLGIVRGGKRMTVTVTLARQPSQAPGG